MNKESGLQANEILFNGVICFVMEITPSAQKHWGSDSVKIFSNIYSSLDGQNRKPDWVDDDGMPCFALASNVGFNPAVPQMMKPYRSTVFRIYEDTGTLEFFHGCPRREQEYNNMPEERKRRIE